MPALPSTIRRFRRDKSGNPVAGATVNFTVTSGSATVSPTSTTTNAAGQAADVGVIPLPAGENELDLINMWRDQVQLPATTDDDSGTVQVGGDTGKLFEFVSTVPIIDQKFRQRMMVAMLTRGSTSWFFKITGEDSFVVSQKDVFLQFLKSVSFSENTAAHNMSAPFAAAPAPAAGQNENANSIWTVPPGWQSMPPSQFLLAQYLVQDGDARAEVNISELAGEGGGLLANVNRWRGQLGLPPIAQEDDFSKMVDSVVVPGGQGELVDMTGTNSKTGQPSRLIGVVLPQAGQTWFYKLMGDPKLVAAQKDAFIKFIQSARYPDAR
ncbi:MAG: Ig-like domain-containing protein [Verrucomicrobiota bacterium]